ncbi:MAG: hypothetical protein CMJ94_10790 [Planctomycetes bacterium]|nr:hypothetical protein [Planctomycetota bacterium]
MLAVAVSLPPVLRRFMDWAEQNPALGVVAVLALIVVLLWLVRKSIKFFMVVAILLVAVILGSYLYYGPEQTNKSVRENVREVIGEGRELINKGKELLEGDSEDLEPAEGDGQ